MESRSGLTVAALIIGILGLGMGGYSLFSLLTQDVPEENSVITSVQHIESEAFIVPTTGFETIPQFSINVTIKQGETVYFSLSGYAYLTPEAHDTYKIIQYRFGINNIGLPRPKGVVRANLLIWEAVYMPISLQHHNNTLAPGTYNISVQALGVGIVNQLLDMTLTVMTYK